MVNLLLRRACQQARQPSRSSIATPPQGLLPEGRLPELRKDPVIGRWVIIASERARRPSDFNLARGEPTKGFCPFCPGNEAHTPPEVYAQRTGGSRANAPGWSLRVVPNRHPALIIEGGLHREGDGMYDKMSGVGAHEVIIESASHDRGLSDLAETEIEAVLLAWKERIADLKKDTRFRSVLVFKNHGGPAGAALDHPHSQLIALPIVPRQVRDELEGARRHYELKERCIFCDIVRQEQKDRARMVYENDAAVVIAPWAPRSPFETWILPKAHSAHYEDTHRNELRGLANALRTALRKLDGALERPAYNLMLHTAPVNERGPVQYHWHVEIVPALTRFAGFEAGSGFYINPTPPEEAAEFLRNTEA